jgi:succinate dehydrogenase / fumarate reductase, cytochrome b subunit
VFLSEIHDCSSKHAMIRMIDPKEVKYDPVHQNQLFKEAQMGLKRNVSLATGLRYQGQGPMLTFVLHRIGGLGMAVFVTTHILSSFLGGDIGKLLNTIYENWLFQIVVFFCVLFHAINGLRITILDLWPKLIQFQREAIWIEWAVFIPIYAIAVIVIISTGLGG